MDRNMNHACQRAINALAMSEELHVSKIAEAINPYEAAETVARHLVDKGFAKEKPFKHYEITPYGRENLTFFKDEEMRYDKELFEHKMKVVQSWVNTIISVAALVISIIALCK